MAVVVTGTVEMASLSFSSLILFYLNANSNVKLQDWQRPFLGHFLYLQIIYKLALKYVFYMHVETETDITLNTKFE